MIETKDGFKWKRYEKTRLDIIKATCSKAAKRRLGVDDVLAVLARDHKISGNRHYVRYILFKAWQQVRP